MPTNSWLHPDSSTRYGTVSRLFHWVMAICFVFVFSAALAHYFVNKPALDEFLWPAHKPVGTLLLTLVPLRALWAVLHRGRRPPHVNQAAHWGHRVLYLLMFTVPTIALIRQYGSGRAFSTFGIPLMPGRDNDKIEWMTKLGSLFHGALGWVLLALVAGHITMALWHRYHRSDIDVLPRMVG